MKSLCVLQYLYRCVKRGNFIILIRSASPIPVCVIECRVCAEWKITLKFIKLTDRDV